MPKGHGPRFKSRKDKADYEKRLRTIARMAIRKITEEEIAMALGIDQTTVSRDLDEIQRRNLKNFQEMHETIEDDRMKLLAELDLHFKEVERELWSVADNNKGTPCVAALREIREMWVDKIDLLFRLGLIAPKSSNTEATTNFDAFLAQIEARRKERGF